MAAEQPKPRFEPPPWEKEAFERFQQDKARSRAEQGLEEELRRVRVEPLGQQESSASPAAETPAEPVTSSPTPAIPEAKIDAMLVQLRSEEPPMAKTNMSLINGVVAFLGIAGVLIVIQSALLFVDAKSSEAVTTMIAATMSVIVLATGLGFLTGAVLLFRKYHR